MAEAQTSSPKRDLGKLMAIAFMAVNLLGLGGGAALVYLSTLGHKPKVVSESQLNAELDAFKESLRKEPVLYQMETFNTNLEGIPRRLVRVTVSLEMLDAEGFEEVIGLGAEARDSVVRILNAKTFDDLETVQGKLHLKSEIKDEINSFLEQGVVQNVYFTEFAVQ